MVTDDYLAAAERAVVGASVSNVRALDEARELLTGSDFADPDLAAIFNAATLIREEHPTAREIDWLTVAYYSQTFKPIHPSDLQRLVDDCPVYGNVTFYARKVADASTIRRYAAAALSVHAAVEAGRSADEVAQKALNAFQEAQNARQAVGLQAKPFQALMETQDAPYKWVVPGFIEEADRFVLTGHEGLGKSMFLRQAAVLTSAGINFVTGKPMTPKRVLVVDVENSERQWRRTAYGMYTTLRERGNTIDDRLHVACHGRLDITRGDHLASLHRLMDQHDPDLMVIGPLYKLTPKAINSDDDAAPVITALDSIRERGSALMLETHMGHGRGATGDRDVRPRGSAALLGWPEMGMGLAPVKDAASEGQPVAKMADLIRWRNDRDPRPWPDRWVHGSVWPWEAWE